MPIITNCVHGNAFYSEQIFSNSGIDYEGRPVTVGYQLEPGQPRGWGRTFQSSGWYHVAIPNMTYFDGRPMYLDEILILLDMSAMVFNEIHTWEAGSFFWTGAPDVSSPGNLLFRPRDSARQRMHARAGLGVSLRMTNTGGGYVTFKSASVTLRDTR